MSAMKKKAVQAAVAAAMGALMSLPAAASSVDGRYGLFGWGEGFGIQFAMPLSDRSALRFRLTDTDWDGDEEYSDVDYNLSYKLRTSGIIFDWRPGSGIFFLSGGLLYNHKHEFYGTATGDINVNGTTRTNVSLRADVEWDRKTVPYIGLGWGNVGQKHKGLAWSVELGIGFVGDLDVRLTQTSGATISANDLAAEQRDLEDDLDFMRRYPMISFGLGYSF